MEVVGRKKYSCKYPGGNNWFYVNIVLLEELCFSEEKPSSHSQNSEIMGISCFHLQDHNYCGTGESEV
jgi:hypothetical protein